MAKTPQEPLGQSQMADSRGKETLWELNSGGNGHSHVALSQQWQPSTQIRQRMANRIEIQTDMQIHNGHILKNKAHQVKPRKQSIDKSISASAVVCG